MTWVVNPVCCWYIDTVMDLTSKFIPAMQKPADWWDEQSVVVRKSQTL